MLIKLLAQVFLPYFLYLQLPLYWQEMTQPTAGIAAIMTLLFPPLLSVCLLFLNRVTPKILKLHVGDLIRLIFWLFFLVSFSFFSAQLLNFFFTIEKKESLFAPWLYYSLAIFSAPFAEELLFRTLLFANIQKISNSQLATVLTALLFALAHTWPFSLSAFISALILQRLYNRYGIIASFIIHILHNVSILLLSQS